MGAFILFGYLLAVGFVLGTSALMSKSFRERFDIADLILAGMPGVLYAVLESISARQDANAWVVVTILLISLVVMILSTIMLELTDSAKVRGLVGILVLAILLWGIVPVERSRWFN